MRPLNIILSIIIIALFYGVPAAQPVVIDHSIKYQNLQNAVLVGENGVAMKSTDGRNSRAEHKNKQYYILPVINKMILTK